MARVSVRVVMIATPVANAPMAARNVAASTAGRSPSCLGISITFALMGEYLDGYFGWKSPKSEIDFFHFRSDHLEALQRPATNEG